ncbi:MAG: YidC/Oxa1 family membrane protein insertase [Microcella sp.]
MDPSTFFLIGPLITAAARGIDTVIGMFDPALASASAPLVIAGITLLVRAALIPLDVRMTRAEGARRRLAPQLAALRTRWKRRPEELQRRTMQLYRDAGVSPLAGMGSMLAQAPIVSVLYLALIAATLDGEPNPLVLYTLAGVSFAEPLGAAAVTGAGAALLLAVGVVASLSVAGWAQRRTVMRLQRGLPAAEMPAGVTRALGVLPFVAIVPALLVPLGAGIYLVVSVLWSTIERPVLRRILWTEAEWSPR